MSDAKREIAVYDGTDRLGHVAGLAKRWRAFDARGSALPGEFKNIKAAVGAVNAAAPLRSCAGDASARMDGTGCLVSRDAPSGEGA